MRGPESMLELAACAQRAVAACALLAALAVAPAARAAELYFSGGLGISAARGDVDGTNDLGISSSGSDDDSSPVYGGALGIAFPLTELVPWRLSIPSFDVPYFPGRSIHFAGSEDFRFPGWRTQFEIEAQTGRDFDLVTSGPSPLTKNIANVTSSSFMTNFRLDIPIQAPLHVFFGRLPMLEPVTLYGGAGVGASLNEIKATDTALGSDKDSGFTFAYQFKTGLGYALTDTIHLSLGYRYYDLGELETSFGAGTTGQLSADVVAHELTSGIAVHFYRIPFLGE
jgi:opacity protein-like surface antigen